MREAESRLGTSDAPDLDVRWLLAHVLEVDHREASLRSDRWISAADAQRFHILLERRATGEPLAHILGEWEFYGHVIEVTPAVMVPRPETELMVEWVLSLLQGVSSPRVVEIGIGSGAVTIALALERSDLSAVGVDISAEALAIAGRNLARHRLEERVELRQGSHFDPLEGVFDLVYSNPPYIAPGDPLLQENVARHEPAIALIDDVDGDGLGHHRRLIEGFDRWIRPGGALLLECGMGQVRDIEQFARSKGFQSSFRADLADIPRVVLVQAKAWARGDFDPAGALLAKRR
ncbi:MAG: peptide chain release factor N(5)-glutamine methyltransferase [Planctomycetota bacterium]